MDKEKTIYIDNRIPFSLKRRKGAPTVYDNMMKLEDNM